MKVLKIKDEIDLKELGFKKEDEDFVYVDDYDFLIEDDRRISSIQFFGDNEEKRLCRLYDLIKDDIVECVEV